MDEQLGWQLPVAIHPIYMPSVATWLQRGCIFCCIGLYLSPKLPPHLRSLLPYHSTRAQPEQSCDSEALSCWAARHHMSPLMCFEAKGGRCIRQILASQGGLSWERDWVAMLGRLVYWMERCKAAKYTEAAASSLPTPTSRSLQVRAFSIIAAWPLQCLIAFAWGPACKHICTRNAYKSQRHLFSQHELPPNSIAI